MRLRQMCRIGAAAVRSQIQRTLVTLAGIVICYVRVKCSFDRRKINMLEMGAGSTRKKNGFITLDVSLRADYPYDLRLGLPFPNGSLDLIYAEHVFEHFSYRQLVVLFSECYDALKSGGVLSLVVPNARIYLSGYFHPNEFDQKEYCRHNWGLSYKCPIDYVNYIFYMDGAHRYMFDEESIQSILRDSGFREVRIREFDPNLDQLARKYESIYAAAVK